jgi:hypothetical protein
VEALEDRRCPAPTVDYWQPGLNPNTTYKWNEAANWSENAVPGNQDKAIFDHTKTGADYDCTVDANANPYSLEFINGWSNTLTIAGGIRMECVEYLNMQGDSFPKISMRSVGSRLIVDGASGLTSTWNGGIVKGAQAWIAFNAGTGKTSTVNCADNSYCDSNIEVMGGVSFKLLQDSGPFTLGEDHNAWLQIDPNGSLYFATSRKLIQNSSYGTNSYIYNVGVIYADQVSSCEVDIPIRNVGTMYIDGTFTMDGTYGATSVEDNNLSEVYLVNKLGLLYIGEHSSQGTSYTTDVIMTCPTGGCIGYYQENGKLIVGDDGIGGAFAQTMETNGANAYDSEFLLNGGTVDLSLISFVELDIKTSASVALLTSEGNTTFKFFVNWSDNACSHITTTNIDSTIRSTDTCAVFNGKTTPNSPKKTLTFLKNGTGSTETGLWGWDFSNTADPTHTNWTGCAAGGGDLTATH